VEALPAVQGYIVTLICIGPFRPPSAAMRLCRLDLALDPRSPELPPPPRPAARTHWKTSQWDDLSPQI
jgi:hypothetical protein